MILEVMHVLPFQYIQGQIIFFVSLNLSSPLLTSGVPETLLFLPLLSQNPDLSLS